MTLSDSRADASSSPPAATCDTARALENLGRLDAAEKTYLKVLEQGGGGGCASAGLTAVEQNDAVCAKASALKKSGQDAKAKEAYVAALESHPGSDCASQALSKERETGQSPWSWAATAAKDVLSVVGFAALGLACIGLLIWVALQFLTRISWTRNHRPARWLLQPRLEVKSFDDTSLTTKMGSQTAILVRGKVTPDRTGGITVVTGHAALSDILKPLGDVSSEAKAAVSIVSFFFGTFPRPDFEVIGALQPKGEDGRGVSVELTSKGQQLGSTTVWERDFEAPDDDVRSFQALAVPTAAWIDHLIAETQGRRNSLLSRDPRSWMMFKTGAAWQESGNYGRAKALYQAALAIDPNNIGAMANLGAIEIGTKDYEPALTLLTGALTELEGRSAQTAARFNPDWYRIKYNVASVHANQASEEEASSPSPAIERRLTAHEQAKELAQIAAEEIAKPSRKASADLLELLARSILPAALALYAGTARPTGAEPIEGSPRNARELRDRLRDDKLQARAALSYVTRDRLTWKVQYDLACAYSQLGDFDEAESLLKGAVNGAPDKIRKPIAQEMLTDPSLEPLRRSADHAALLEELRAAAG
jgi:tetratricopeptide (TPR) repeat protein